MDDLFVEIEVRVAGGFVSDIERHGFSAVEVFTVEPKRRDMTNVEDTLAKVEDLVYDVVTRITEIKEENNE